VFQTVENAHHRAGADMDLAADGRGGQRPVFNDGTQAYKLGRRNVAVGGQLTGMQCDGARNAAQGPQDTKIVLRRRINGDHHPPEKIRTKLTILKNGISPGKRVSTAAPDVTLFSAFQAAFVDPAPRQCLFCRSTQRIGSYQAVPPTVRPSMRSVGMPTPTGTLCPSLPQVPTPESSCMSLPIMLTRVMASGPFPMSVAP